MRFLILGSDGMPGHRLYKWLHAVKVRLRQDRASYRDCGLFDLRHAYTGVDVQRTGTLLEVFADFRPAVVVNAAGIVKQRAVPIFHGPADPLRRHR